MTRQPNKQDVCANCGHKYLLHLNFKGECDACDSPEYNINEKCLGFKLKEEEKEND